MTTEQVVATAVRQGYKRTKVKITQKPALVLKAPQGSVENKFWGDAVWNEKNSWTHWPDFKI